MNLVRHSRSRLVVTTLTALFASILSMSALAETTLKYTDHDPLGGMRTQFNKDVWLPEIEKQTFESVF